MFLNKESRLNCNKWGDVKRLKGTGNCEDVNEG
jgi:hypothetical protein